MRSALTLFATLVLSACATFPGPSATTDSPTAGFGQTANVGGVLIRPISLVEDSRCPINARCVWAGRLILRTQFSAGGPRETRDFILGTPQSVPGGILTLVGAEPGKLASAEGNPPANRFTFELTR